ncbi:MAG TPA: hypothetical protein VHZ74_23830 [Bryobacteraceae bacterium]|nr:hypothetical protein [Bryobacteraceae bacterium]
MIIGLSIVLLLITAVGLLTRFAPGSDRPVSSYGSDVSFLENFSPTQYRPMLRLASQMDRKFLLSAHGETLAGCYRKIQRDLLREYLRDASRDFSRLYSIATAKCVQATSDPDDLSMGLFEQQMTFIMLVWGIEARLLVDGLVPFSFDLKSIIEQMEGLARETRALARPQYSYQAL